MILPKIGPKREKIGLFRNGLVGMTFFKIDTKTVLIFLRVLVDLLVLSYNPLSYKKSVYKGKFANICPIFQFLGQGVTKKVFS